MTDAEVELCPCSLLGYPHAARGAQSPGCARRGQCRAPLTGRLTPARAVPAAYEGNSLKSTEEVTLPAW